MAFKPIAELPRVITPAQFLLHGACSRWTQRTWSSFRAPEHLSGALKLLHVFWVHLEHAPWSRNCAQHQQDHRARAGRFWLCKWWKNVTYKKITIKWDFSRSLRYQLSPPPTHQAMWWTESFHYALTKSYNLLTSHLGTEAVLIIV